MKNKFKLISALTAVLLLLTGCVNDENGLGFTKESEHFKILNQVTYPDDNERSNIAIPGSVKNAMNEFAFVTAKELFTEEKNHIYSPISLYFALSMLTEGVSTQKAKSQLDHLLGIDVSENHQALKDIYGNNYYVKESGTLKMANSFWFNDNNKHTPIKQTYIDTLTDHYYAEAYQTNFDETAQQNIVDWINYYTENFLELTTENFEIDPATVALLLNTIYFDGKWQKEFVKSKSYTDDFTTTNGVVSAKYMTHEVKSVYLQTDYYEATEDYFQEQITITYIKPKEGYTPQDILSRGDILSLTQFWSDGQYVDANITLPKCKYKNTYDDLKTSLIELGVEAVFTPHHLENIRDDREDSLYVEYIRQNAGIEFNEEGVKAAAVTDIGMTSTSIGPSNKIDFKLDKPFIYLINSSQGIPLFVGIIENPNK